MPAPANCQSCSLHTTRHTVVNARPGDLSRPDQPLILFVGQGPGKEEDQSGSPFVGRAGIKLTNTCGLADLHHYYLTNCTRCWTGPGNPAPHKASIIACSPYLREDIESIKPDLIVAVGRIAEKALDFLDVAYTPILHPAAVFHRPQLQALLQRQLFKIALSLNSTVRAIPAQPSTPVDTRLLAIDTETDAQGHFVLASVSDSTRTAVVLSAESVRHYAMGKHLVFHHALFDAPRLGVRLSDVEWDDTMLMAAQRGEPSLGLDVLGAQELGVGKLMPFESLQRTLGLRKKDGFDMALARDSALAKRYAAQDAAVTLRLYPPMRDKLAQYPQAKLNYERLVKPAAAIIQSMIEGGVCIDSARLVGAESQMDNLLAGESLILAYNSLSPKQVLTHLKSTYPDFLYNDTNSATLLKWAGFLNEAVLEEAVTNGTATEGQVEVNYILLYRSAHRLRTLARTLRTGLRDGRLHSSYSMASVLTGRLSSSGPNLQNIPQLAGFRQSLHPTIIKIRQSFVARPGYKLVRIDLGQLELRVWAHIAQDDALRAVLCSGGDLHTIIAQQAGIDRRLAKTLVFGRLYGGSVRELAAQAGVGSATAVDALGQLERVVPSLKTWPIRVRKQLYKQGYLTTLGGRMGFFPAAYTNDAMERAAVLRSAANFPVQGGANDIFMALLISLFPSPWDDEARLVLSVYDEVIVEVAEHKLPEFQRSAAQAIASVEQMFKLSVPLAYALTEGDTWYQA